MSFEFHHMDKWAFANLDLIEEILETKKKAVVLIAGASSSGKSFAAEFLTQVLLKNGHKAVTISLDQYNYGLSGIIPNKVNANYYDGKLPNLLPIERKIKDVIYDVSFEEKYSDAVLPAIQKAIHGLLPKEKTDAFLKHLQEEWKVVNFDEPTVYNLKEAADDVRLLYSDRVIREKRYSKVVSERIPNDTTLSGKGYDVVIVEGIYGLNSVLVDALKGLPVIKDFIDGNPKSLFLRRIIRDQKLTSADNVFTVSIYFKYIVKAYLETILPCRDSADVILNNDMSFTELRAGDLYTTKTQFQVHNPTLLAEILKNGTVTGTSLQKDIYFTVPDENLAQNNILRFREISHDRGKTYTPSSLVHKGAPKVRKDDKLIRPINILLREGQLQKVFPNEDACLAAFRSAGFLVGPVEKKKKIRLTYHGQILTIRDIEGQDSYLEFSKPISHKVFAALHRKNQMC
jgi:uridine kinase/adenylate cyclase class IV